MLKRVDELKLLDGLLAVIVGLLLVAFLTSCGPNPPKLCRTVTRPEIVGESRQNDTIYVEYRRVKRCYREVR